MFVTLQLKEDILKGIIAFDFFHSARTDELAFFDDGDFVAKLLSDLKDVGAEEDGSAFIADLSHHIFGTC